MVMTSGDQPMILQRDYRKIRMRSWSRPTRSGWWSSAHPDTATVLVSSVAGTEGGGRKFDDWFFGGQEGEFPLGGDEKIDDHFHALTLSATVTDGRAEILAQEWDNSRFCYPLPGKYSIGIGRQYATAAMMAGADAIEAMRITIQLDAFTDGEICYVDMDNWERGVQVL
jgi:hypothetical protein